MVFQVVFVMYMYMYVFMVSLPDTLQVDNPAVQDIATILVYSCCYLFIIQLILLYYKSTLNDVSNGCAQSVNIAREDSSSPSFCACSVLRVDCS